MRESSLIPGETIGADSIEHRQEQRIHAAEVIEDERRTEATRSGDRAYRRRRVARADHGAKCGLDDSGAHRFARFVASPALSVHPNRMPRPAPFALGLLYRTNLIV